ncbi:RNA polymerase sigma factor [Paenibacillus endoradicis]|uniref:RNA polymerase sigma factor n=1 Tax=Paenibacillus endoradicis TaxID=2972487 RepID=UPI0021597029|nr:RNA polymerase sigma factor [Paenibacillus endoradicis]MCR8657362.1 RNA polymerase sigma factor [Paenibacillus endoradicis]
MEDFSDVYNEYAPGVYRFLLTLTRNENMAEEITQETFYRAFRQINNFRGESSLYGWLCQIAKNIYFNESKKNKRTTVAISEHDTDCSDDFTVQLMHKEQAIVLHQILHGLPDPYKEVFTLKIFGELKFREISALFGKSESWAKITYYRAKERIINEMEEQQ